MGSLMLGRRRILAAALVVVAYPAGVVFAQPVPFRPPMPPPRREVRPRRPGGPGPWYWVTRSLAVEWPPLGLGVRALATLSGRGLSGWAGPIGWERARCPAANVRLAPP